MHIGMPKTYNGCWMLPYQAKQEAEIALTQHGLLRKGSDAKSTAVKIPNSDQLSVKRVDPAMLEVCFCVC